MAQFSRVAVKFPDCTVMIYAAQPLAGSDRPVAVFLHGALRRAELLAEWGDRLADIADVVLVDLPGHGARDRKSTRLNSSHPSKSRMPSSA